MVKSTISLSRLHSWLWKTWQVITNPQVLHFVNSSSNLASRRLGFTIAPRCNRQLKTIFRPSAGAQHVWITCISISIASATWLEATNQDVGDPHLQLVPFCMGKPSFLLVCPVCSSWMVAQDHGLLHQGLIQHFIHRQFTTNLKLGTCQREVPISHASILWTLQSCQIRGLGQ